MPVDISDKGAVRTITINRPEKLNALSLEIATDICNAVEAAATDQACAACCLPAPVAPSRRAATSMKWESTCRARVTCSTS